MGLLLRRTLSMSETLQETVKELNKVKYEHSITQNNLHSTEKRLSETEKALQDVSSELEDTKRKLSENEEATNKKILELQQKTLRKSGKKSVDRANMFDPIASPDKNINHYSTELKSIMKDMPLHRYRNYTEDDLFLKIDISEFLNQIMVLAVVNKDDDTKVVGQSKFQCNLFNMAQINSNQFCVYIYNPRPKSNYETLYLYHPVDPEKKKIVPYSCF